MTGSPLAQECAVVPPDRSGPRVADSARWFYVPRPVAHPRLRLFCFPYAGGGPTLFRPWPVGLPDDVELCAVTLPGRAARIGESPCSDLQALSRDIAVAIGSLADAPSAFFGHSLGALLAFETARRLRDAGGPLPRHLFVSARPAPDIGRPDPERVADMDDAAFAARLAGLGGTPPEVLADRELMALLLPALKADFVALERWRFRPDRSLPIPITAFAGERDRDVAVEAVRAWSRQTRSGFVLHVIDGDHFFLHDRQADLLELVRAALAPSAGD